MKVLLASSEVHPYSKTGGLADMVGALGWYLALAGIEVTVITPLYGGIEDRFGPLERSDYQFDLPLGTARVQAGLRVLKPQPNLTICFVEQHQYYNRPALYQERGQDYPDNAHRFIFFAKCVAHLARYMPGPPDLVHVHDWQPALAPLLIKHAHKEEGWGNPPKSILTIHNLAYQGFFPRSIYELTNLPADYFHPDGVEFHLGLNCLKAGIVYADLITTVSRRYAREILTEAYGCGLDGLLRARQSALLGILNGVDYAEWNTTDNPYLRFPYSEDTLEVKIQEKLALQQEMGLPQTNDLPLFATITRLADQKGIDILLSALEEIVAAPIQFVLLGSGSPEYERAFQRLALRYPAKVAIRLGYDPALAHRIEAGADFYLMPSKFEPCGLNQLYSLRYGTIPIVRTTGGLDDSVTDIRSDPEMANGIKFQEYSGRALVKAMRKALVLYGDAELLRHYRLNGMRAEFSWERTSGEYASVYEGLQAAPV